MCWLPWNAVPQNDEAIQGWRTGPVAVTGASGQVGTPLRRRLGQLPNEVRPLGRDDDLASAFGDADAVVHLAGTLQLCKPNTYRAAKSRHRARYCRGTRPFTGPTRGLPQFSDGPTFKP